MTGGRLKRLKNFIPKNDTFMFTYGDGISNVNLKKLELFHKKNKKIITVTAVRPPARFGEIVLKKNTVTSFKEKPQVTNGWINGGFFIAKKQFFEFIKGDFDILEKNPLEIACRKRQLVAFKHSGFWKCMDVKRDRDELQKIYKKNSFLWEKNLKKVSKYFKNKRVLITGTTGFKGSWLSLWMQYMGANVLGISNGIISKPSNFDILNLKKKIKFKKN